MCTLSTGTLNVLLRVRSIASVDTVVWTKSGHQGPDWKKAFFDISPSGPFQVRAWQLLFFATYRITEAHTLEPAVGAAVTLHSHSCTKRQRCVARRHNVTQRCDLVICCWALCSARRKNSSVEWKSARSARLLRVNLHHVQTCAVLL